MGFTCTNIGAAADDILRPGRRRVEVTLTLTRVRHALTCALDNKLLPLSLFLSKELVQISQTFAAPHYLNSPIVPWPTLE